MFHTDGSDQYTRVTYGTVNVDGLSFVDGITTNISLSEGYNLIQLVTCNSENPAGEGNGTFAGTAPMIDCIKIDTTAVLMWDGVHGLPFEY